MPHAILLDYLKPAMDSWSMIGSPSPGFLKWTQGKVKDLLQGGDIQEEPCMVCEVGEAKCLAAHLSIWEGEGLLVLLHCAHSFRFARPFQFCS